VCVTSENYIYPFVHIIIMTENTHTLKEQQKVEQALKEAASKIAEVLIEMLERNNRELPVYSVRYDVQKINNKEDAEKYIFYVLKDIVDDILYDDNYKDSELEAWEEHTDWVEYG